MNDIFLDEIVRPEQQPPPSGDSRGARRAGRAERDRKRRKRRKNILASLVVLAVLGGSAFAVVQWGLPFIQDVTQREDVPTGDFPGPGHTPVEVVIPPGATGGEMAAILFEAGVVASPKAFTTAFSAHPDAASIQPGTYRLLLQMKASAVVAALLDAENRVQTRVTIPEGLPLEQILETLASRTALPIEEFRTAMEDVDATGLPAEAGGRYEGWLFPATYTFEPGTTPTEMIRTMIAQMVTVLDERGVAPADRFRVITTASLVEREAGLDPDRPMMARAIQNRLDQGMLLQIDAAVAYGAGIPGTELTRAHLEDPNNPYNTYVHAGLPPGPIASPGAASIDAVLAPADGAWLFWVTINLDTKETRFTETYAEHQENVALLRQWEADNAAADADDGE